MAVAINSPKGALRKLRQSWLIYAVVLGILLLSGFQLLRIWWVHSYALFWASLSAAVLGYELWVLWNGLHENHRHGEQVLLSDLGAGNIASLARGALIGLLYGFLFLPRPSGWLAWIPGILYTLAVLIDFLDGYLARITNHVTRLGEIMDMHLDGLGVLVSTLLIVPYNPVPWWYVFIGLARYFFLAGTWLWNRSGKPLYEMPSSNRRRGLAGLQMGFIFVMLWPLFSPPGTHLIALGFGFSLLLSFTWDWLIVIGVLPADAGDRFPTWKRFLISLLPVGLRAGITLLLAAHIYSVGTTTGWLAKEIPYIELAIVLLMAAGVAGRITAVLGLAMLGFSQMMVAWTSGHIILAYLYIAILILGSGDYSLWMPEEWLVYHKAGEHMIAQAG